ncbi:unnamed protein product [Caenorhabditis nigoni]
MKTLYCLFVLLSTVYADVYNPQSYTDRPCGDDLSNLWLDVIAVVDNSQGMTTNGLISVGRRQHRHCLQFWHPNRYQCHRAPYHTCRSCDL